MTKPTSGVAESGEDLAAGQFAIPLRSLSVPRKNDQSRFFVGGTRISMELDGYRESVDIDFLSPDKASYRSVRETVTERNLG